MAPASKGLAAAIGLGICLGLCTGTPWLSVRAETGVPPAAAQPPPLVQTSGLPVPRYVSLKSDRVHVRQGPGTEYKVLWVYRRAGLPVEVIREFDGWRQIRDAEGTTGWVLQSLVSGRRTVLIMPWETKTANPAPLVLRADDRDNARAVAIIEPGVLATVRSCDGAWCYLSIGEHRGYFEQKRLWGVYEDEKFK